MRARKASVGQVFSHMGPHDAAVWQAFLDTRAVSFECLCYDVWNAEKKSDRPGRPVVVCSRVDDDVEEFFSLYGVLVIVVSVASESEPAQIVKVIGSWDVEPALGARQRSRSKR